MSTRRERQQLNEGRLRELAQVIDAADTALTTAQHHVSSALSVAQEIGALGHGEDRWQAQRDQASGRTTDDLNTLWSHSNLIRLRVSEDHALLQTFDRATEALSQTTTLTEELLEVGLDRHQRQPIWETLREARKSALGAQSEFETAARDLLGPRLVRVKAPRKWPTR